MIQRVTAFFRYCGSRIAYSFPLPRDKGRNLVIDCIGSRRTPRRECLLDVCRVKSTARHDPLLRSIADRP